MIACESQAPAARRTPVWREIWAGLRQPAVVTFLVLWLAAGATLVLRGQAGLMQQLVFKLVMMNFIPIVLLRTTAPA